MADIQEFDLPTETSVTNSDFVRVVLAGSEQSSKITKANLLAGFVPDPYDYILIVDQKAANTAGGASTSGSFATRTLNTELFDTGSHASVSSNQVTLAAGTYYIRVSAPAFASDSHQCVLYSITAAADVFIGTPEYSFQSGGSGTVVTRSVAQGMVTIGSPTVYEIRHRVATSKTVNGLGVQANFGVVETYSIFEAWRQPD